MDIWNITMSVIFNRSVQRWQEAGYGITLDPARTQWTHIVCVDSITLFARLQKHLETMANDLTEELRKWGLH